MKNRLILITSVFVLGLVIFLAVYTMNQAPKPTTSAPATQSDVPQAPPTIQPMEYLISKDVQTTRERTIVPIEPTGEKIKPWEIAKYEANGYGQWTYGPGVNAGKIASSAGYFEKSASVTHAARLLRFFAMTDVHITDKENPAQLIYMSQFKSGIGANAISLYSGIMLYTTHVLDAAMQTVNALHNKTPIDFGISLGDVANSGGYNEIRWYIDVIDGKVINPDSGAKDDPIPGPHNDYQDIYKAVGLDPSIPWYQTLGNHDRYWMGSKPASDYLQQTAVGETILKMGNLLLPGGLDARDYYMGTLDGSTVYGDIVGTGSENDFEFPPKVAADPDRRLLNRQQFMSEFLNSSSLPKGHGFTQKNVDEDFACYSFEPKADVPIKVIVLDSNVEEITPGLDPHKHVYGYGTLDEKRYNWLVAELEEGQANDKLMIIAAHTPIGVEVAGSPVGWWKNSYVSEPELIAKLQEYPNLMLWMAGHRHLNKIRPFPSPDAKRPELAFWGVETVSLREFPQQIRLFEILRNSDDTISIMTTNVDPAVAEGSMAATSRSYAIAAAQAFGASYDVPRNAELIKHLTPAMQEKIKGVGKPL